MAQKSIDEYMARMDAEAAEHDEKAARQQEKEFSEWEHQRRINDKANRAWWAEHGHTVKAM